MRNAFTLLELLVVIGIIAILMVLVAPGFHEQENCGRHYECGLYNQRPVRAGPKLREGKSHVHMGRILRRERICAFTNQRDSCLPGKRTSSYGNCFFK
jgi:prepilin-type N-terminal cleavage/methylation domain-containing protein